MITFTLTAAGLLVGLAFLVPYIVMVLTALTSRQELLTPPAHVIPRVVQWSNFTEPWGLFSIGTFFKNSLMISFGATAVGLVAAIPAGYALARTEIRFRNGFLLMLLMTQMLPPVMLVVGIYQEFRQFGLLNSLPALIFVNAAFTIAFAIFILADVFRSIPEELEEAASIDGASRTQTLLRIVLPLAGPGTAVAGLFIFIGAWNEFTLALTVLNRSELIPISIGLFSFAGAFDVEWPFLFATATMATVPIIVVFVFAERWLVSGLTIGSVD